MKKKTKIGIIILSIIVIISIIIIKIAYEINVGYQNALNCTFQDDGTILERLTILSEEDSRISTIIENYDSYPEEILNMLCANIETLDFVLNYPEKKNKIYADNIGEVKKGEFPLLLQWDERWGYAKYGNSSIAASGCACASLAMVIAGLTGENKITPYIIAKYAEENDYYTEVGTSWSLLTEGSKNLGVVGTEIILSKSNIYENLMKGIPIICSMRPGDFTTIGHFIVLIEIENGKIKVNDPNSVKRSNMLWDYENLEYQIKNLWIFEKI